MTLTASLIGNRNAVFLHLVKTVPGLGFLEFEALVL